MQFGFNITDAWFCRAVQAQMLVSTHAAQTRARLGPDLSLPLQLWDLQDKCQPIQEPLIVAREAPQRPPASGLNGLPCRGPCEPQCPFCLPIPSPHLPRPLLMLINRPYLHICILLCFDGRQPLASINFASGVPPAALKRRIKRCESL